MFNISQFRELIIKSTLNDLKMYSENAEELLVFTCAAESMGGTYLTQVNGSALGIYQMMPETYNDIWENYIKGKTGLNMLVLSNFNLYFMPPEEVMIYDLRLLQYR
jgi:dihydrodipicolinate synthase/N-acetylneuraminate lyase